MPDWEAKARSRAAREAAGVVYDRAEHAPHLYGEADRQRGYGHLTAAEVEAAEAECRKHGLPLLYKWQIAHNAWVRSHEAEIKTWAKQQAIWPARARKIPDHIVRLYLHGGEVSVPHKVAPGYQPS